MPIKILNYLQEDVPIFMLLAINDPSSISEDQFPIQSSHKQVLLDWAQKEPQRKIKLYYISTGLKETHIQKLHELTDINKGGQKNIEIIDFCSQFTAKYDITYLDNDLFPFIWKRDITRLIILRECAPGIYIDFNIKPCDTPIGKVPIYDNNVECKIILREFNNTSIMDTSVMVVNTKNHYIIETAYHSIKYFLDQYSLITSKSTQSIKNTDIYNTALKQLTKIMIFSFLNTQQNINFNPFSYLTYACTIMPIIVAHNAYKFMIRLSKDELFKEVKDILYFYHDCRDIDILLFITMHTQFCNRELLSCDNTPFIDTNVNLQNNLYNNINCNTKSVFHTTHFVSQSTLSKLREEMYKDAFSTNLLPPNTELQKHNSNSIFSDISQVNKH
ncbi:hypothetical protein [Candidatus Neoehrlichia procyonis]|uniref:Uncharacterized protein n=1 Tax=Candidatus Neoehrlichia procyonis str. RAC413 TaxID=1359163 RepID=A0A0F3NME7_9RICK|nr:hypothetical protein [Candidatus Neoehrlichia lotoris]KJV68882.1 hypothetical protein NLO413_0251 [Candidatus Neoehrlichia lotoris str. RAC413]